MVVEGLQMKVLWLLVMGWRVVLMAGMRSHPLCATGHMHHKCTDPLLPASWVALVITLVLPEQCVQFPHAGEVASECASCWHVGSLELGT